jgi:outer membrane protein TolC
MIRDSLERVRSSQEELEATRRRRDEAESRLVAMETEYEELLGSYVFAVESTLYS